MQMQDYLPFFRDLLLHYYQFTLDNSVYAICLAITVWLLTAVFYSLRIGLLNRRNRITLKASLDAQNGLVAAQEEIQRLQAEITAAKEQIDQEVLRTAAQHERIAEFASQLSASIVAMAAEPELGQQGLSVTKDLEVEHLWQRYSAAVKQLGEDLIAERKNIGELKQAYDAEAAKLAEKDGQIQAMQTRLDSQRQQLAKLELAVEEQKTLSAEQLELAQRRLSEAEAKHQADLSRLAALEKQSRDVASVKPQPEEPKVVAAPIVEPAPPKTPEVIPVPATPTEPQQPKPVVVEPKPAVTEAAASESTIARAEYVKQQQVLADVAGHAPGGVGGKFKSLFAGAKQQMEKLDDMFGLNTPMLEPKEATPIARSMAEPQIAATEAAIEKPEMPIPEPQPEIAVNEPAAGLSGKFKNLFGSAKATAAASEAVEEKPAEPEPQPAPEVAGDVTQTAAAEEHSKLKTLFGVFLQRKLKNKAK